MEQTSNDKVSQKFDENIGKLLALLKGGEVIKRSKIKSTDASSIIDELIADKVAAIKGEFKTKASELITAKVDFDKFVRVKEKEFNEAINSKKKEFNAQMENLFSMLESIDEIRKSYEDSLATSQVD